MLRAQMRRLTTTRLGPLLAAVVAAATALGPASARAQGAGDKAAAEALFDEGKRLYLDKKFAQACPRFEASERIDPGIGTLLYLADCYESVGRVASAWATFREAASTARANGQGDRETVARERAALLEPKLHRLTLEVKNPPPGLKIQRNDVEVKADAFNVALPVDPGPTTITATAPGKKAWSTRLEIASGPGAQTLAVPPLEDNPTAHAAEGSRPGGAPAAPEVPEVPGRSQRIAGIVVGSVGVAVLAVGSALGGLAASTNASAKTACPLVPCSNKTGVDQANQAGTFADGSTAALIVGGAALAAGVVTFLTAPRAPSKPLARATWMAPFVGPGRAGLAAGSTF